MRIDPDEQRDTPRRIHAAVVRTGRAGAARPRGSGQSCPRQRAPRSRFWASRHPARAIGASHSLATAAAWRARPIQVGDKPRRTLPLGGRYRRKDRYRPEALSL